MKLLKNIKHFTKKTSKRTGRNLLYQTLVASVFMVAAFALTAEPVVHAYTAQQRRDYAERGISYIDEECAAVDSVGANVTATKTQDDNAKVIIGIAKTLNLGKEGARIGLMVALAESGLKNYASRVVPISQTNPVWLALPEPRPIGQDYDSVGVFQQRVSTGWSTFGNGESKDIVFQLMDPAYAAQAFFGVADNVQLPAGLKQPSALRKGLQNINGDWKTLSPWVAAQRVQISAYDGRPRAANNYSSVYGGNYKDRMAAANGFLARLWDEAQPVPLPIGTTGAAPTTSTTGASACPVAQVGAGGSSAIIAKIKEYAWSSYISGRMTKKPEYAAATSAAAKRGEYTGSCAGVDCGAFVTRVMRDSGADPNYNKYEGNTLLQMRYLRENSGVGKKYTRVQYNGCLLYTSPSPRD